MNLDSPRPPHRFPPVFPQRPRFDPPSTPTPLVRALARAWLPRALCLWTAGALIATAPGAARAQAFSTGEEQGPTLSLEALPQAGDAATGLAIEPGGARLKASPRLAEEIPEAARDNLPTYVEGARVGGRTELETVLEGRPAMAADGGRVTLRRGDRRIAADRIEYDTPTDLARARGNVRINRAGDVFEGPELELKVDAFEGFFTSPNYRFIKNDAYGEATRIDFIDNQRALITDATYTTCQREPGASWGPAWLLTASSIRIDNETETGYATGAVLRFMGVPILPVPAISFPLSDKRKSGLLPPTIGLDNVNGIDITQPYYWNIAPNRDATFFPTLMSKRGLDLGGEFRYLESNYSGQVRGAYMPSDKLRDSDRWAYAARHNGSYGVPLLGNAGLAVNLNRVSDDNYWRDFSRSLSSLTQRLLANDVLATGSVGRLQLAARALKWQTLQDPLSPIVPPYDRLPQFTGRYLTDQLPGGLLSLIDADYTGFKSDRVLNNQPNAKRAFTQVQVGRYFQTPGWFVTPKLQLHARRYDFDQPLGAGSGVQAGRTSASVTVPTASLDSGLVFERETKLFGRNLIQTLEPRAFYVNTPFRDQNYLPVYDTAANDFNFATIYTENAYGGNDRIADNNLLTLGATTRFLDGDTGAEAASFGVAQRLRFKDQRVVLPGQATVSERLSDVLFGASLAWSPKWRFDSTVQYNPDTKRSIRSTVGAYYSPGNYRVVSAAYRLARGSSELIDIGWQWPVNDLWGGGGADRGRGLGLGGGQLYAVGRANYSLRDKKLVDTIAGFEYDGCCWIGRVVFERLQSATNQSTKRILFQLEFNGFSRLGSGALKSLKDNIPRYQYLREQTLVPSRFGNYE